MSGGSLPWAEQDLSTGVRRYVEALRNSTMRLYAVDDLYPGASLVLKDVLTGSRVTVKERLGSRHLHKYDLIAARIIDRGLSGLPEIEVGMLAFPPVMRQHVISVFSEWHKAYRLRRPHSAEKEFFKKAPVFFHEVGWTAYWILRFHALRMRKARSCQSPMSSSMSSRQLNWRPRWTRLRIWSVSVKGLPGYGFRRTTKASEPGSDGLFWRGISWNWNVCRPSRGSAAEPCSNS